VDPDDPYNRTSGAGKGDTGTTTAGAGTTAKTMSPKALSKQVTVPPTTETETTDGIPAGDTRTTTAEDPLDASDSVAAGVSHPVETTDFARLQEAHQRVAPRSLRQVRKDEGEGFGTEISGTPRPLRARGQHGVPGRDDHPARHVRDWVRGQHGGRRRDRVRRRVNPRGLIVYTGGTFDLFHAGHVKLLRECRTLAGMDGRVVVSLNTDEFVQRYKNLIPTHPYEDRRTILEACRYVDLVVRNAGDEDSKVAIDVIRPNIIAIGEDWRGRDYHAQMGFVPGWLAERGIEIIYVTHLPGRSAANVRRRLATVP
jgi:glycerol-3-phosphate cytidylyltransferase